MPGQCKHYLPLKIKILIVYGYKNAIKNILWKKLKINPERTILKMKTVKHLEGES